MARISRTRIAALVERLLADQTPLIRQAFIEAMRDARDSVRLQDVVDALSRGDIAAAAEALSFDRTFLAPLDQALAGAYYDAGRSHNDLLMKAVRAGGLTIQIRFDPGAPRAAAWVRQHSSELVTEIVKEQRDAIREALGAGLDAGINPRQVARDIVGRIDKETGRRAGGIVGLTSGQEKSLRLARAELESGDPTQMRAYLKRKLRDRTFDGIVNRAIREGRGISALDVRRIAERYSDKMLYERGVVIGRTETLTALSYAQDENMSQLLETGGIRPGQVKKKWSTRADGRTRDSHVALSHATPIRIDETFRSPVTGAMMRFPRDSSLGAGGEDTIQCRCYLTHQFDWGA